MEFWYKTKSFFASKNQFFCKKFAIIQFEDEICEIETFALNRCEPVKTWFINVLGLGNL
jgi:hypothetical protein